MHDIRWIREHREEFDHGLNRRGLAPLAQRLIDIDEQRRAAILKLEEAQARRNAASKEIAEAKRAKSEARAATLMTEVAALKTTIPELEAEAKRISLALEQRLAEIPNLPLDDVPNGEDERGNVERHHFGARANFAFTPKQHFELGEALGQMDFETAAKLSGARFVVLKNGLARLERALGQFMLDVHTQDHGYTEVNPPLLVRDEVMFGTAQLPKFVDDQFLATRTMSRAELLLDALSHANDVEKEEFKRGDIDLETLVGRILDRAPLKEDFWLIPTAEVPLTNLVRDSIVG
jgi:seryl-tRNA synthetase